MQKKNTAIPLETFKYKSFNTLRNKFKNILPKIVPPYKSLLCYHTKSTLLLLLLLLRFLLLTKALQTFFILFLV